MGSMLLARKVRDLMLVRLQAGPAAVPGDSCGVGTRGYVRAGRILRQGCRGGGLAAAMAVCIVYPLGSPDAAVVAPIADRLFPTCEITIGQSEREALRIKAMLRLTTHEDRRVRGMLDLPISPEAGPRRVASRQVVPCPLDSWGRGGSVRDEAPRGEGAG
jgi:hypothetical protein